MKFLKYSKSVRFIQFMAFWACWFHVCMCVSFSMLLPVMVETPTMEGKYGCVLDYDKAGRQVSWTQLQQGYVLAAYGVGYFLAQLASAPAVNTMGSRWVVLASTLVGGICSVLLPIAVFSSWIAAFFVRLITGFAGGVICDSIYTLLERWVTARYKINFFFIATASLMLGVVITWIISGALMKAMSWWILPFLVGGPAILWSIVWALCVRNGPEFDSNRNGSDLQQDDDDNFADYLPMSMMFSSCPFISLIFLYYADMWGISLFFLVMPKFMYDMLGLDIFVISLLCSLAVCFRFASAVILEFLVRQIFKYDILDTTSVRKMFVFFSHAFTGVAVITLGYMGCNSSWLPVGVCFTLALSGASSVTSQANARDLSPVFVRTLFVVMHFIGLTSAFILPNCMGLLLTDEYNKKGWTYVFYIAAGIYIITALIFLIFGSGDVQPWNFPHLYLVARSSKVPGLPRKERASVGLSKLTQIGLGGKTKDVRRPRGFSRRRTTEEDRTPAKRNMPPPKKSATAEDERDPVDALLTTSAGRESSPSGASAASMEERA